MLIIVSAKNKYVNDFVDIRNIDGPNPISFARGDI